MLVERVTAAAQVESHRVAAGVFESERGFAFRQRCALRHVIERFSDDAIDDGQNFFSIAVPVRNAGGVTARMRRIFPELDPIDREASGNARMAVERVDGCAMAADHHGVIERHPWPAAQWCVQRYGLVAAYGAATVCDDALQATRWAHEIELDPVLQPGRNRDAVCQRQPEIDDRASAGGDGLALSALDSRADSAELGRELRIAELSDAAAAGRVDDFETIQHHVVRTEIRHVQLIGEMPRAGDRDGPRG